MLVLCEPLSLYSTFWWDKTWEFPVFIVGFAFGWLPYVHRVCVASYLRHLPCSSLQSMRSLLSICWMEIYVKNIIYTYRKRTYRYVLVCYQHVVMPIITCLNSNILQKHTLFISAAMNLSYLGLCTICHY